MLSQSACQSTIRVSMNAFSSIEIRPAQFDEVEEMKKVLHLSFAETYKIPKTNDPCFSKLELHLIAEDFRAKITDNWNHPDHKLFVAIHQTCIIGIARIIKLGEDSFLDKLYVLKQFQGCDVGNALLLMCMKSACEEFHSKNIRLEIWDGNVKSIQYYQKNQFHRTHKAHTKGVFTGKEMVCEHPEQSYNALWNFMHVRELEKTILSYLNQSTKVEHGFFAGQLPRTAREIKMELDQIKKNQKSVFVGLNNMKYIAKKMGKRHPVYLAIQTCQGSLNNKTLDFIEKKRV